MLVFFASRYERCAPDCRHATEFRYSRYRVALGGVGTAAAAAGTLSKLGLKPETIVKLTPALVKVVQSKGGAEVGSLLAGALK